MTAATLHYLTAPGTCACGEQSNNTWTMAAHLRSHRNATTVLSTVLPAADAEPTYLIAESGAATLGFDSLGHYVLHPPSPDYLDRLAAKATALAGRMRELDARRAVS